MNQPANTLNSNAGTVRQTISDNSLFIALLVLLVWIPMPLGSVRPWAEGIMQTFSLLLLAGWIFIALRNRQTWLPEPVVLPAGILFFWMIWQVVQIIPLPLFVVDLISPAAAGIALMKGQDVPPAFVALSLDPGSTLNGVIRTASLASILVLTVALLNTRRRVRIFIWVLVVSGIAQVVYALANLVSDGGLAFWEASGPWSAAIYGSYVNRNHFAGFLEMIVPLSIALILASHKHHQHYPNLKARMSALAAWMLSGRIIYLLISAILIGGLLLTTSRGGNLALLAALAITSLIYQQNQARKMSRTRLMLLIGGLVAGAVYLMGAGGLEQRLIKEGLSGERVEIRKAVYPAIADFPLTGTGSGTFEFVFPIYKTPALSSKQYSHAHNDYLQLVMENGVVIAALVLYMVFIVFRTVLRGLLQRRDPQMRAAAFGSLAAMIAMLIHALADFNFQIPANAGLFFSIMGLGITAATLDTRVRRTS